MKATLASLFKPYRPVLPITAHRNVRMRGQAFVSFRDKKSADQAKKDVNEFPLYGKPIVSRRRYGLKGWVGDARCRQRQISVTALAFKIGRKLDRLSVAPLIDVFAPSTHPLPPRF